jgi:hypothetical protein
MHGMNNIKTQYSLYAAALLPLALKTLDVPQILFQMCLPQFHKTAQL